MAAPRKLIYYFFFLGGFFGGFGRHSITSSGPGAFSHVPRIISLRGVWKKHFSFNFLSWQAPIASGGGPGGCGGGGGSATIGAGGGFGSAGGGIGFELHAANNEVTAKIRKNCDFTNVSFRLFS
jgi:hypothetical protein